MIRKILLSYLVFISLIINCYAAKPLDYSTSAEYFKNCGKTAYDRNSPCYIYLSAVIDTMTVLDKRLCIKNFDSNKIIYEKVMKVATNYLKRKPSGTIFTIGTILSHSLVKTYPCNPNDTKNLIV
jgi:hypothetical protein